MLIPVYSSMRVCMFVYTYTFYCLNVTICMYVSCVCMMYVHSHLLKIEYNLQLNKL